MEKKGKERRREKEGRGGEGGKEENGGGRGYEEGREGRGKERRQKTEKQKRREEKGERGERRGMQEEIGFSPQKARVMNSGLHVQLKCLFGLLNQIFFRPGNLNTRHVFLRVPEAVADFFLLCRGFSSHWISQSKDRDGAGFLYVTYEDIVSSWGLHHHDLS